MQWTVVINYDVGAIYVVDNIISYIGESHVIKLVTSQLDLYFNLVDEQYHKDFETSRPTIQFKTDNNKVYFKWEEDTEWNLANTTDEIRRELVDRGSWNFGDDTLIVFPTPKNLLYPGAKARYFCNT